MDTNDPIKLVTPRAQTPGRRKGDGIRDWRVGAPRWALLLSITALLFATGWLVARLETSNGREMETLRAALEEAGAKAQNRLLERVAVTEEQQRQTNANVERLILRMDKRDEAIADLTTQLRLLTAELKRAN